MLVLTGYGSIATAVEAVRRGAMNYLNKPVDTEQILAAFGREGESGGATGHAAPEPNPVEIQSLAVRMGAHPGTGASTARGTFRWPPAGSACTGRFPCNAELAKLPPLE